MYIVLDLDKIDSEVPQFEDIQQADAYAQKNCQAYRIVPLHFPTKVYIRVQDGVMVEVRSEIPALVSVVDTEAGKLNAAQWRSIEKNTIKVY